VTTRPLRDNADQRGFLKPLLTACDAIGDGAVVAVGSSAEPLPPAIRAWCGAPTVQGRSTLSSDTLNKLAREWKQRGRELWVVGANPQEVRDVLPDAVIEFSASERNDQAFPISLTRPPTGARTIDMSMAGARVPVT